MIELAIMKDGNYHGGIEADQRFTLILTVPGSDRQLTVCMNDNEQFNIAFADSKYSGDIGGEWTNLVDGNLSGKYPYVNVNQDV